MSQVYNQTGANDTPVLVPGWTVQNSGSGTNQSLTGSTGPQGALVQSQTAPTPTSTAGSATDADLAAVVNKLKAAGVFK